MFTKHELLLEIRDYIMVAIATLIYAIGITFFMLPYELATGGVSGIAICFKYAGIDFIFASYGFGEVKKERYKQKIEKFSDLKTLLI